MVGVDGSYVICALLALLQLVMFFSAYLRGDMDPLGGFDQEMGQGWGLDDLVDIAVDLTEVLWLIDHHREADAIWEFRWGYENHWGDHLHVLRYLHKLLYWG